MVLKHLKTYVLSRRFLGDRVLNEPKSFCEVRKVVVVSHERFLSWSFLLCSSHWYQAERGSAGKKTKKGGCAAFRI